MIEPKEWKKKVTQKRKNFQKEISVQASDESRRKWKLLQMFYPLRGGEIAEWSEALDFMRKETEAKNSLDLSISFKNRLITKWNLAV